MARRAHRLRALTCAVVLCIATRASAQTSGVQIELTGETRFVDAGKLESLVQLELGSDSRVRLVVVNVRDRHAEVDVVIGNERRGGSLTLAAVEPERALALFVAELAHEAEAPPGGEKTASPLPSAAPPAPVEPRPTSQSKAWRFSALASMGARLMTTGGAVLATPRLELGVRRDESLRIGVIARYAHGSADDALGVVSADGVSGGIGGTYMLAASANVAIAVGPRLELGFVAGRGRGSNADSATAPSLAPAGELELHLRLGAVSVVGALEAGFTFRGIKLYADERDVLHVAGPFVGAAVGVML